MQEIRRFPVNIAKFLRTPTYFEKHLETTAPLNSRAVVFQESLASPFKWKALNFWNFVATRILIWLVSFVILTVAPFLWIYYARLLVHHGRFHRLAGTGSDWKPRIYLPYSPDKFSKFRRDSTCFVFSKKFSEFLFFLMLFSAGIYLFRVRLKRSQNGYIFFFFYSQVA